MRHRISTGRSAAATSRGRKVRTSFVEPLESRLLFAAVLYVDAIAPGPVNDGSSWANAYTSLQAALGVAVAGQTIEVGQGTYFPTSGTDRTATFRLIDGVSILGGFAGYGAANPDARNVAVYPTTLSGDIGVVGNNADNSYNVVTGNNTNSTAVIGGFTITGGNADGGVNTPTGYGAGGGIAIYDGSPTITDCTFTENFGVYGGAIYNDGQTGGIGTASATITDCVFNGNSAGHAGGGGGAIFDAIASPTIINCAFIGNNGNTYGGAIDNSKSSATITNCTFTNNFGSIGEAICDAFSLGSTVTNCILWGDAGGSEIDDLDGGSTTVSCSDVEGGFLGNGNINADPQFVNPSGGNIQLQSGSPCVNAGNNVAIAAASVTTDLGGNPRIVDGVVDMGAYEFQGPFTLYVDQSAIGGADDGTSWPNAFLGLQQALGVATPGFTIDVAQGTYYPTTGTDRTVSFQLEGGVAIYGGFAGDTTATPGASSVTNYPTILSGNIGNPLINSDNSYHVVAASGVNDTAILDGFTISAGNADGSNLNQYIGGGMYIVNSSPTLTNCTFTGCSGESLDINVYSGGGGIYDNASSPTLTNCVFSNNSAGDAVGGGMFNDNSSSPTLTDCTFSGNMATNSGGAGGGMFNNSSTPILNGCNFNGNNAAEGGGIFNEFSSPTLTNCKFSGNTAGDFGGGISDGMWASPTLIGCIFTGNSAMYYGGGIINENATLPPTLTNCVFSGNIATFGGAIYNDLASPTLTNCTFNGNTATNSGGGIWNQNSSSPTLTNCICWGDSATIGSEIDNGTPGLSGQGITTYSNPVVTYSDIQSGFAGTGNRNADPLFVNAAAGNLQLQPGSPCIDAGSNAAINATDVTTDVAGNPRIVNGIVDMGAYEYQGPIFAVKWIGLGDGVNWSNPNNWSGDFVPTATQSVTIPAGVPVVDIGGVFSVGALTSSSPIEILRGGALTLFGSAVVTGSLTIDTGGTLDIQSNSLTINYNAGADPVAAIRRDLRLASDGGLWDGVGLTSSTVEAQVASAIKTPGNGVYAIGYIDGSVDIGQTAVVGNQLFIRPTIVGDTDLNGSTNFFDLGRVAQNLSSINADWYHGDFNYDGTTNFLDIGLLAQNLNKTTINTPLNADLPTATPASTTTAKPNATNLYAGADTLAGVWTAPAPTDSILFADGKPGDILD
jgi:parallel beta-helix repeat protein